MKHKQNEFRSAKRREAYKNQDNFARTFVANGSTKVNVYTKLTKTSRQGRAERVEVLSIQSRRNWDGRPEIKQINNEKSIWGIEQHKTKKVETVETSQQRAERLEVLSKRKYMNNWEGSESTMTRATRDVKETKQERFRQGQVYNEQSDLMC